MSNFFMPHKSRRSGVEHGEHFIECTCGATITASITSDEDQGVGVLNSGWQAHKNSMGFAFQPSEPAGVWCAYYLDGSGLAVFGEELPALRYALERSMQVKWLPFGVDLQEAE